METVSRNNGLLASALVQLRHERQALFPTGLFDEYGWETLLVLYAARVEDRAMTIDAVNQATGATGAIGQRWMRYLEESGQLTIEGDVVALTEDAAQSAETWLTRSVASLLPLGARIAAELKGAEALR